MINLGKGDRVVGDAGPEREDLREWYSLALEVGVAISNMHVGSKQNLSEQELLNDARDQIAALFHFDAADFALVNEADNDFRFSFVATTEAQKVLMEEVNRRIDDGHFAWALNQIRPVVLPTGRRGMMLLLCTLATRNRIRGMFAAVFTSATIDVSEAALSFLMIIVANTANALESIILYGLLEGKNKELEQKVMERTRELEIALRHADSANEAKSAFVANVSHEIRTPLTSVIGYAELLRQGAVPPEEQAAAITSIVQSGRHLLNLVNDILDMAKIEAGRVEVAKTEANLGQLLTEVEAIIAPQARRKGLAFRREQHGQLPQTMTTDPLRLRQILLNLLGNAIKFTEHGEVALVVRTRCDEPLVKFEVCDTGIGIREELRARLFEPFQQSDASISRQFGGTGLGLYLAKQCTELIGGDLTLDEGYRQGARFLLAIPVKGAVNGTSAPTLATPVVERDAIKGRILVADDTPENRHLVTLYLRAIAPHVSIETAVNGREAVEKALAQAFDLVIMDWHMPELDGLSATQFLRRAGYAGAVTALTASALAHDREDCIAAGCDDFLTKPIDEQALRQVVQRHLGLANEARALQLQESIQDTAEFRALQRAFLVQLEADVALLEAALQRRDFATVVAVAHKLKGGGGSFGYPAVTEVAARLEKAARIGAVASATTALAALTEQFRKTDGETKGLGLGGSR